MEATSVENVLKKIGFGKVQVELIAIGALLLLAALNDTLGTSFFLPASQCDLELTTQDKGFLSGMTFLGVTVSSYFWGFLGDTKGRRWVILNALVLSSCFSILSAFMKSFSLFVACRFMVGVFVSGYSTTLYAYIGEFNTDKNRTIIISWITVSIGLANMFIPMSAMWILSCDWSFELYAGYFFRPWRLLMIVYTSPGIIAALWLLRFKESPKFLLMRNKHDKAVDVLLWIQRSNKKRTNNESFEIRKLECETRHNNKAVNSKNNCEIFKTLVDQTMPLMRPPFLIHVLICSLLHFGTFAISNGAGVFIPDILNKLSHGNFSKICDVFGKGKFLNETDVLNIQVCNDDIEDRVFLDTAILGFFYTIAFISLAIIVKFVKRKHVLHFNLFVCCIAGFALIHVESKSLILIAYFAFVIFAGINISVINSAACDAIPTNFRSMSVCVAMLFGRLGSVITSNFIGSFVEDYCDFTHYSLACLVTVCFALSFLLP